MSYKPKSSSVYTPKPASAIEGSLKNDKAVPTDATDTISCVRWSPASNHLAAASWDGKVRIYDVGTDLVAKGVAMIAADAPVLSCDWNQVSQDGI